MCFQSGCTSLFSLQVRSRELIHEINNYWFYSSFCWLWYQLTHELAQTYFPVSISVVPVYNKRDLFFTRIHIMLDQQRFDFFLVYVWISSDISYIESGVNMPLTLCFHVEPCLLSFSLNFKMSSETISKKVSRLRIKNVFSFCVSVHVHRCLLGQKWSMERIRG